MLLINTHPWETLNQLDALSKWLPIYNRFGEKQKITINQIRLGHIKLDFAIRNDSDMMRSQERENNLIQNPVKYVA